MTRHKALFLFLTVLAGAAFLMVCGCSSADQTGKAAKQNQRKAPLSSQALDHFRQAHKFLAEKKMDESLKEFQESVRLSPDSPLATFWLGKAHLYRKERDQAEKYFRKVLEMDPQNYHALAMLGRIYAMGRTNLDQAEDYLKKALDFSPENLEAHFDLARVYAMQGKRDQALRQFHFLFVKESDFFIYHFELGRMMEAWGQKEPALREYRRAHLLNPKFSAAAQAIKHLEDEPSSSQKLAGSSTKEATATPAPVK